MSSTQRSIPLNTQTEDSSKWFFWTIRHCQTIEAKHCDAWCEIYFLNFRDASSELVKRINLGVASLLVKYDLLVVVFNVADLRCFCRSRVSSGSDEGGGVWEIPCQSGQGFYMVFMASRLTQRDQKTNGIIYRNNAANPCILRWNFPSRCSLYSSVYGTEIAWGMAEWFLSLIEGRHEGPFLARFLTPCYLSLYLSYIKRFFSVFRFGASCNSMQFLTSIMTFSHFLFIKPHRKESLI